MEQDKVKMSTSYLNPVTHLSCVHIVLGEAASDHRGLQRIMTDIFLLCSIFIIIFFVLTILTIANRTEGDRGEHNVLYGDLHH